MKSPKLIIKKVKKHGHDGHHGGAWKVAYADFVTGMMAFFLLLWLLSMVSPEKRVRLAAHFKSFTIFEKSGTSMVMDEAGGVVGTEGGKFGKIESEYEKGVADVMSPEDLKSKLKREIETKLSDVKDHVLVDIFQGGVRIQLVDLEGSPMFPLASSELTPKAKKILEVITRNIKDLDNKVAIEGHTDALNYASNNYTNWELSTERASAARKELERNGLDSNNLSKVAGYAATDPLIKDNPADPRNRRISIILLYPDGNGHIEKKQILKNPL